MYILTRSLIETLKTLLISIVCSVVFAIMIYRDSALPNSFVCTILNTASLLLFLYLHYANWCKLYENAYSPAEYFVPAITAFCIYAALSSVLYATRFFSLSGGSLVYMFMFLPSRFLEPKLNSDFAFVSVIVAHVLLFGLIFMTPPLMYRKR